MKSFVEKVFEKENNMIKDRQTGLFAILVLLLSCVVLSCSSGTAPTTEEVDLGEVGSWTWVKSVGGIAGETFHADSVDYTKGLIFDSVSNYVFTYNKAIRSAGRYVRTLETVPGGGDPVWVVRYSDNMQPSEIIERIDADTLVLAPLSIVDGFTITYSRSVEED